MDRQIVYPGSIPLDTDILSLQRDAMVAIGYLAQATLGSSLVVDGLSCTPTTPTSMRVTMGPGSLAELSVIDASAFGSLPADSTDPLVKIGINTTPTTFTLTAPTSSGYSVIYLIEATLSETDATPVVLPYYNAANPTQPFSGANNSGVAQNTQRLQRVSLQLKPGVAAAAGSQTAPAVDSGWVGLYTITVANGQTAVNASAITTIPTAPFVPNKLPQLMPGFSRMVSFTASGTFTVPAGITVVKARLVGGGGGGGGGDATHCGSGGGAGGYVEGIYGVTPGQSIPVTVGAGGGGTSGDNPASNGGTSAFGGFCNATGGSGGTAANGTDNPGGGGGTGNGGTLNLPGGYGSDGYFWGSTAQIGGNGGASFFGGGGRAAVNSFAATNMNGQAPGSGAGGSYGNTGPVAGGSGAAGLVIVEY